MMAKRPRDNSMSHVAGATCHGRGTNPMGSASLLTESDKELKKQMSS